MNQIRESAASGKHQLDGPPRLNSSRCGTYDSPASGFNQSAFEGRPLITKKGDKLSQELAIRKNEEYALIEQVVMKGDLSQLTPEQRVLHYRKVCESSGLNPFTNPFAYISLNGKLTLYAKKDCTEQLRKIHGVSIEDLEGVLVEDIYVVTAKARDKAGRIDQAKGAVVISGLKGEAKANAIMKAETKAKRRVTLSICGMGWTDESEIDSIPNALPYDVDFSTGEIKNASSPVATQPKINSRQVSELELILGECDEAYKKWFYGFVKKAFGTDDLSGVTVDRFEGAKAAATKNMEANYQKMDSVSNVELLASGEK